MKSKWYFMTFLMIAGFIGLLFLSSAIGNTAVTTLTEEFPAISEAAGFEGTLIWDQAQQGSPLLLTDSQFLSVLTSAQLKDRESFDAVSLPAMKLHFTAAESPCTAVICRDGKVSVKTRDQELFFKDSTGILFRTLYEEHLLSGGQSLPE